MSTLYSNCCTIFPMYEARFLTYSMLLKITVHRIEKIATFFLSKPLCTGVSYMSRNTVTYVLSGLDHIVKPFKTMGSLTDIYSNCQHFEM